MNEIISRIDTALFLVTIGVALFFIYRLVGTSIAWYVYTTDATLRESGTATFDFRRPLLGLLVCLAWIVAKFVRI